MEVVRGSGLTRRVIRISLHCGGGSLLRPDSVPIVCARRSEWGSRGCWHSAHLDLRKARLWLGCELHPRGRVTQEPGHAPRIKEGE